MPGGSKKGGGLTTKKSAFYLKSGNKASYSDLQVQKESPVKWVWLLPLLKAAGAGAASALGSKLVSGKNKKETSPPIISEQKKIM